jgi:hypothetical protein
MWQIWDEKVKENMVQGDHHNVWNGCKLLETHPCFGMPLGLFFVCKLSSDFVVYRLFNAEDELFVGDVITKSPVLFHRLASPVGLFKPFVLFTLLLIVLLLLVLVLLLLFTLLLTLLLCCNGAAVE